MRRHTRIGQRHPKTGLPSQETILPFVAIAGIVCHLVLRYVLHTSQALQRLPLITVIGIGGIPLVLSILRRLLKRDWGTDLLAAISVVACFVLREYLAGSILVLMWSGGTALERYATHRASAVLDALARRMPQMAHRKEETNVADVALARVAVGDTLIVFPQELCPVDGIVVEGRGSMDESYLTGEPFVIAKAPGSTVLSGAINQEASLTIRAEKRAIDSRYAKIMEIIRVTEQQRPAIRRLGDQVGAWYTPLALAIASVAWIGTGDPIRFLSVLVIATPCPLLIAIPVAIIGAISLAAKRGIIIKTPSVLEQISTCQTFIFDKTGTLTYGRPTLTEILPGPGFSREAVLRLAASLERYSKHPLAGAIVRAAQEHNLPLDNVIQVNEMPGAGLLGIVAGHSLRITGRKAVVGDERMLPPVVSGLECLLFVDGTYAATFRFHDAPRRESRSFLDHLQPRHQVLNTLLVSGDRESEVQYLAEEVGISTVHFGQTPEDKVAIVQRETQKAPTLFVGDGINDAPALMAATVGIAFGHHSDITSEAADAIILEAGLIKVDELLHISRRMRAIVLQSALGGMGLSLVGMGMAALGYLPPVPGAIAQELIDLLAVLNAVRVSYSSRPFSDCVIGGTHPPIDKEGDGHYNDHVDG